MPALARNIDIRQVLLSHPEIALVKAIDYSSTGLKRFQFCMTVSENRTVEGQGADFKSKHAITKAWAEFLERFTCDRLAESSQLSHNNSNGFATHISLEAAQKNALGELVERDVFLSSWLSGIKAQCFPLPKMIKYIPAVYRVLLLQKKGVKIDFGIFGKCMNYYVGAAFLQSTNGNFAVLPAAHQNFIKLLQKLTIESAIITSDWNCPEPMTELNDISDEIETLDHMRYYLRARGTLLKENLFSMSSYSESNINIFPDFPYLMKDHTPHNHYAQQTGFHVAQAYSDQCQNLWFGKTQKSYINFERLRTINNREITYKDVVQDLHPLC